MNNIFMGSYMKSGLIYDYSGVWSRTGGGLIWKAVVRNADVVCRPAGTIRDEPEGLDTETLLSRLVEEHIEQALERR
jgi:hypothetical protein